MTLSRFASGFIAIALMLCAPLSRAQTVTYVHTDALGSVVAETDASGNVVSRYVYEPYGASVGDSVADGPAYTGHVSDSASGLSYMQQRYMDPQLGVFLSVDPVTAYEQPVGQFNRYRYGNGNPYKFTDPDGRRGVAGHYAKDLGRIIRAYYDSGGDEEKFEENLARARSYDKEVNKIKLEIIVDTSRVGAVKDLVEIGAAAVEGDSVTDKAMGIAAGDAVEKVAEKALSAKIGPAAANAVGAFAGKVAGDVAEAASKAGEQSMKDEPKSSGGVNLRDKK